MLIKMNFYVSQKFSVCFFLIKFSYEVIFSFRPIPLSFLYITDFTFWGRIVLDLFI